MDALTRRLRDMAAVIAARFDAIDALPMIPRGGVAGDVLTKVDGDDAIWVAPATPDLPEPAPPAWGVISGSLSSQTDLQTALNAKTGVSATRSAMNSAATSTPVFLTESGREGIWVWDSTDFQAKFGASLAVVDPNQGLFVAPSTDATGSSGARVRKYDGGVRPEWWGAKGDDKSGAGTNDGAAFAAMLNTLAYVSDSYSDSAYRGATKISLAAKAYYLGSTTLDFNFTVVMEGQGTGLDGGLGTRLRWAANQTGIRVQRYNTNGESGYDVTTHRGGDGSVFRGIFFQGAYSGTEGEYHGFHLRARASIENCYIYNFQGDGIHIWASQGSGVGGVEGNANVSRFDTVGITSCRNGIFADGADANAGCWTAINCQSNRAWGIYDSSFLGNYAFGCHFDLNGIGNSFCSYAGRRYQVVPGMETGASTNAPSGTTADNTWWKYSADGGAGTGFTAWTSGLTWRSGGHYFTDSTNGSLMMSYLESGGGYSYSSGVQSCVWGCFGAGNLIVGTWFGPDQTYGMYSPNGAAFGRTGAGGSLTSLCYAEFRDLGAKFPNSKLEFTIGTFTAQMRQNVSTGNFYVYNYDSSSGNYGGMELQANSLDIIYDIGGSKVANFASGGLNLITGSYKVAATQVVGTRKTGWAADTGTAKRSANSTYAGGTANAAYNQAEITAIRNALQDASQTIKALKDDLISHGLIGA